MTEIVFIDGVRTPLGRYGGAPPCNPANTRRHIKWEAGYAENIPGFLFLFNSCHTDSFHCLSLRSATTDRRSECRDVQGCTRAAVPTSLSRIAPAPGPGQLLDRYAVSPSPCAPRCTYLPVAHRSRASLRSAMYLPPCRQKKPRLVAG